MLPEAATKIYIVALCRDAAETLDRTIASIATQAGNFDLFIHVQDGVPKDGVIAHPPHPFILCLTR